MDINDFMTTIGQSLAGSPIESEWNTIRQNPDFWNVLNATSEIMLSMNTLYPHALTTESEKQALRDSIHTAIVNNAAFQTQLGSILQRVYEPLIFTAFEQVRQGAELHELPQAVLESVQNEIPASQHGVLTNVMNNIITSLENEPPTNPSNTHGSN
jgi:hypothetical protein